MVLLFRKHNDATVTGVLRDRFDAKVAASLGYYSRMLKDGGGMYLLGGRVACHLDCSSFPQTLPEYVFLFRRRHMWTFTWLGSWTLFAVCIKRLRTFQTMWRNMLLSLRRFTTGCLPIPNGGPLNRRGRRNCRQSRTQSRPSLCHRKRHRQSNQSYSTLWMLSHRHHSRNDVCKEEIHRTEREDGQEHDLDRLIDQCIQQH